MARRSLKICAVSAPFWQIFSRVSDLLQEDVDGEFRVSPRSFTRGGPLHPALLVALVLRMVSQGDRRGYKPLLDEVWEEAAEQQVELGREEPVSAEAFCRARQRLRSEIFEKLLLDVCSELDREKSIHRDLLWKGRRLFAADGCALTVRRSPELWRRFGGAEGSYYPQASVVVLADVLARVPYGAQVSRYGVDERAALMELTARLNPGDVLLLDQGFPSHQLIDGLARQGIDFVMRVTPVGGFREVMDFAESQESERTIYFEPERPLDPDNPTRLRLRLVRCKRPGEVPFVLLTSLPAATATRSEVDELYHHRWSIEELFKLPKGLYLNQRQFHSKNADGVRQEIFALLLYIALSQVMRLCAASTTEVAAQDHSQKAALLGTARALVAFCLTPLGDPNTEQLLLRLLRRIQRNVEKRRPNRSYRRRSFQPRRRWDAQGRVGVG